MQLTFRFITSLLQPFSPKYITEPDLNRKFSHVSVMEPEANGLFDPNALYIGSSDKLHKALPDNFIVIGHVNLNSYAAPEQGSLAAVITENATTAGELIALIGNCFLSVGSMADDMLQSLSNSNHLSDLINIAYKYLGNPVVITDTNWKALCMAPDIDINDNDWMLFRSQSTLSLDVVTANTESHLADKLQDSELCLYWKSPRLSIPRLLYNVRIENIIVGTISVLEYYKNFTAEDYVLLPIIANAISAELQKIRTISFSRGGKYEELLADMLDGKITNFDIISNRLKTLNAFHNEYFYIFVLDMNAFDSGNYSFPFIRDLLEEMVADSKALIYKDYIVLFKSYSRPDQVKGTLDGKLRDFLAKRSLRCGVSRCFTDISKMPAAFNQAIAAIDIANHFGIGSNIFLYDQFAIFHIAQICDKNGNLSDLCSPKLKKLLEYDREHNASFTQTLESYFRNSRNITDTAAATKMHRNSIVYHLNRIQEMLDLDFNDPKEMLLMELSIWMHDYLTKKAPDISGAEQPDSPSVLQRQ